MGRRLFETTLHRQRGQQGFTLIELLVVVAVIGFIAGVMVLMFSLVTKVGSVSTAQNIVLSQVQQAGSWMTRDIISSDNVTTYTSGSRLVTMYRYSWDSGSGTIQVVRVDYDVDVNTGRLLRSVNNGTGAIIAQFITGPGVDTTVTKSASLSENNTYIFNVKAAYSNSSFSKVYKMNQRAPQ
jgi:prepilin-type N-terminal cleavage/methylation domain-containing protein